MRGVIVRLMSVAVSLLLAATPAWAQASTSSLQGFNVVLVLGDVQDGATADNLQPGARAALADLKDFLPYRSYRVLDTAWVLASSTTRQEVTSRLRGLDEQDYEVALDRMPVGSASLQVHFRMAEPGGYEAQKADRDAGLRAEIQRMIAARSVYENQLRQQASDPGAVSALRQRLADTEAAIEMHQSQLRSSSGFGGATLIDTSFTMSLGETVVVGTSRMRGGNKALIVLLTAATKGTKPRE
jgi:hypothetical protein